MIVDIEQLVKLSKQMKMAGLNDSAKSVDASIKRLSQQMIKQNQQLVPDPRDNEQIDHSFLVDLYNHGRNVFHSYFVDDEDLD